MQSVRRFHCFCVLSCLRALTIGLCTRRPPPLALHHDSTSPPASSQEILSRRRRPASLAPAKPHAYWLLAEEKHDPCAAPNAIIQYNDKHCDRCSDHRTRCRACVGSIDADPSPIVLQVPACGTSRTHRDKTKSNAQRKTTVENACSATANCRRIVKLFVLSSAKVKRPWQRSNPMLSPMSETRIKRNRNARRRNASASRVIKA